MKHFLACFLFLLTLISFGQNQQKIDSLKEVLNDSQNDTVKIKTLAWLFDQYVHNKPDSAKVSYETMLSLAKEKNYNEGFYQGNLYKSTYYWYQSNFDSVLVGMNEALNYAKKMKDDTKISNCYVRLAMVQSNLGNYEASKSLTLKALEIAKNNNDWEGLYFAYYKLGNTFYYENDFENALINYLKVDSVFEYHERKEPALAASLMNIGGIYMEFSDLDKAETYFLKGKKIYEVIDKEEGVIYSNKKLGELELKKGNYEKSINLMKPILDFYIKSKSLNEIADINIIIADAYLNLSDYKKAEFYYTDAIKVAIEAKSKMLESNALVGLAATQQKMGKIKLSVNNLKKALFLYDEMGVSLNKPEVFKNLATAYDSLKEYKSALGYYKKYYKLKDSIIIKENKIATEEIATKYQTEKKEKKIALLKSQNKLSEQQKTNQRNLLLGGIGLTSLAGLFFFFLYRNRQKTTKKLQELDSTKSNFFTNISHEFRTPLTLISGPIQQQLKKDNLQDDERNNLEMMQRNSNRLLSLVDQLLDISKIETGSLKLAISKNKILPFVGTLADSFTFTVKQKQLNYSTNVNTTIIDTWFDKDVLEKIVINLLSNAVKYTPEKGSIVCNAFIKNRQLHFEVKNTGKGLSNDEITKVFERFYQINSDKQGVGIGLALVKELVTLHKGSITVESTPNEWTIFKVELPVVQEYFDESELTNENSEGIHKEIQNSESAFKTNIDEEGPKDADSHLDEEAPILLIVDDNDDVRTYVRNLFKDEYSIYLGKNGKEGIDLAIKHIPDIIISDIMMPVKNGIELCNTLKGDECTSHIPIILLTARAGEKNEIEGVKTGADDYITKPFSEDLLQLKVGKLIESRKKLQTRYSQEIILRPKDITINSVDEQFLERVQTVLDDKLIESSFSIEEFSQSVGMSRMQLHRKLKALTGLSASEFIRSQRLKLAAQLLKKSDINVSQIGYSVGFNDHAYFSKCFKEMFNCTPTEYVNSTK